MTSLCFSSFAEVERELRHFLDDTREKANLIVLFHCVNIGNIGFFLPPLSYLYGYRSRKLSQLYKKVVRDYPSVQYVNFYRPRRKDFYDKKTRARFIADDQFHPSDYANRFFFDMIVSETQLDERLSARRR